MKELYMNSSSSDKASNMEFLQQYEFDELSSINVIPQSINTWPISSYEFNKLKTIIYTSMITLLALSYSNKCVLEQNVSMLKLDIMLNTFIYHRLLNQTISSLI